MRKGVFNMLLFLFLFQSCDKSVHQKFSWENGTARKIVMENYALDILAYSRSDEYGGENIMVILYYNEDGIRSTPSKSLRADSIVVTYDSTRRQIYYFSEIENKYTSDPEVSKNIFEMEDYERLGKDHYRFTITEEDYENAALIAGE